MSGFNAGKLNRKITIQHNAGTAKDGHGATIPDWQPLATVWAHIKPIGGSEKYINQQIVAETTHQIAIRYLAGVTPKMRVLYGSRVFDILQVHDLDERNIEMRLICKEKT